MGAANGIKPLSERHFAGTRSRIFSYVYQHFFVRVGSSIRRYDKNFYLKWDVSGDFVARSLEGRWKVVARSLVGGRKGQGFCNKKRKYNTPIRGVEEDKKTPPLVFL